MSRPTEEVTTSIIESADDIMAANTPAHMMPTMKSEPIILRLTSKKTISRFSKGSNEMSRYNTLPASPSKIPPN